MILILLLLTSFGAFAQTSYLSGTSETSFNKKKKEYSMNVRVELTKDARTWFITQCRPDNTCSSYQTSLIHDVDGKWYYEAPNQEDVSVKAPAKVEDDHIALHRFKSSHVSPEGETIEFEHNTLNGNSFWRKKAYDKNGINVEAKTILRPVTKETYDLALKGKSITVIPLNRQRPKK